MFEPEAEALPHEQLAELQQQRLRGLSTRCWPRAASRAPG